MSETGSDNTEEEYSDAEVIEDDKIDEILENRETEETEHAVNDENDDGIKAVQKTEEKIEDFRSEINRNSSKGSVLPRNNNPRSCASDEDLEVLLNRIKNIKNKFITDCDIMKSSLSCLEAGYSEQLQDSINTVHQTELNNSERNQSLQRQWDGLKKGARDARQLAGAYRMSRGGAPWMDISQQ